jgi:hypothetical protein
MKLETISVYNSYPAIIAIRNTTRTWTRSDTKRVPVKAFGEVVSYNHAEVGPNDRELICKLLKSSKESTRSNHRKFIRQIFVTFNLTAPKSFWSVFDSYKIGVDTSNANTMRVISKVLKEEQRFTLEDFEFTSENEKNALQTIISKLNNTKDLDMITTILPQSFLLLKSWSGSYENLLQIYLDKHESTFYQWKIIIDAIKELPLMGDLIIPNSIWTTSD